MRVALIHDYLIRFGGAEQVLLSLHRLFPEAPIYTLLYDREKMEKFFLPRHQAGPPLEIRPAFLQKLPGFLQKRYKYFLPLLPITPETFDLRDFDLVISSSSAFAKGVVVRPQTIHICYCHNPMRFIWDYYHQYLREQNFGRIKKILSQLIFHYLRLWDRSSSMRVDYFIANSKTTQARIKKYYRRESTVIYPPVDINLTKSDFPEFDNGQVNPSLSASHSNPVPRLTSFSLGRLGTPAFAQDLPGRLKDSYFLIVSQLTPYKRINLAVEAFNKLELPLKIIGEGPERKKLEKIAKANIEFLGFQPTEVIHQYYQNCMAFIFAGEDDFGIAPIEAMAHGKPVLAFRKGGATETIIEGVTGEFFDDPYPENLADGVCRLIGNYQNYNFQNICQRAEQFSRERFEKEISEFVNSKINF